MIKAQQVTEQELAAQQVDVVPYQAPVSASESTTAQGFLDIVSIIPTMMIMFFMGMMMGLMRDVTQEPGAAKKIIIEGYKVGKEVVTGIARARGSK